MTSSAPLRELIPAPLQRARMLLWTGLLPQAVLLALNLRSYGLVSGEMDPQQLHRAWVLGGLLLALLALNAGLMLAARLRGGLLPWLWSIPVFVAHAAYLWCATPWITGKLIPANAALWILPAERVLYHQYALVMPAIFYAALRLACFPVRAGKVRDLLVTAGVALLIPLGWYVLVHVLGSLFRVVSDAEVLLFLLLALSTAVAVGALLRLLITACDWIRAAGSHGMMALSAVVALVLPLLGLALNIRIPFPADFQGAGVYALAVLNGVLLILPALGGVWGRVLWAAQCAMFAFTGYFFLVFLPFLPLSIVAIVAMGAGVLMLTPTALFALHLWRLADGYRRLWKPDRPGLGLIVGVAAFLLLPGGFTARAYVHRQVLLGAIDHVYAPADRGAPFPGSLGLLRVTLENLRDFKAGLDLPFLTELYSGIVFNGLVLPDEKMDQIHRAFFGRDLERNERTPVFSDMFGTRRDAFRLSRRTVGTPPPTNNVALAGHTVTETEDGAALRSLVRLSMTNGGGDRAEFATSISLPPGVEVSGFWLHIEGERVPGRLFERKTALWVYRMIRDVERRDPATLSFTGTGRLELRVFPFAPGETRTCEIEFLRPAGWAGTIGVGAMPVVLKGEGDGAVWIEDGDLGRLLLPGGTTTALPAWERKPYLHFIVERSALSARTPAEALDRCAKLAGRFSGYDGTMVTLANFEHDPLTDAPVPPASLATPELAARAEAFGARGGFCRDRAIKDSLLRYEARLNDPARRDAWIGRFPVFVVVRDGPGPLIAEDDLARFAARAPDTDRFYTVESEGALRAEMFAGGDADAGTDLRPQPVALIAGGGAVAVVRTDDAADVLLRAAGTTPVVLGPAGARDVELEAKLRKASHPGLAAAVRLKGLGADLLCEPRRTEAELPGIVRLSRESGILVPATCYIALENTAQWRILEAKEKQKLGAHEALEFMESPEPSTWILLGGVCAWLFLQRRWRKETIVT